MLDKVSEKVSPNNGEFEVVEIFEGTNSRGVTTQIPPEMEGRGKQYNRGRGGGRRFRGRGRGWRGQ